jgi:triacylglycerol esterase/lipase EstA (alpha/beta hydrolase family)
MGHSFDEFKEMGTYFRYLLQLGNRLEDKDFYDRVTPDVPPILLIHGFLGTRGAMFPLELRLKRDGFVVFSINLGVLNIGDIRKSAHKIHRQIQNILREVDLGKIDIIGHSMGGLIGLYYIKKLSGHKHVRKFISLGTPHLGTWFAMVGVLPLGLLSPSIWQLLPNNFFLQELQTTSLPPEVSYHSIAGSHDVVCPPQYSHLEGSQYIEVPCGHAGLATSQTVYHAIRDILLDNPR